MKKRNLAIFGVLIFLGIIFVLIKSGFYNFDKLSCELNGNAWEKVGKLQSYDCVIYYDDGGKKCDSSSECEGNCIVIDIPGEGFCQNTNNVFGCKNTIENVKAGEGIMCID